MVAGRLRLEAVDVDCRVLFDHEQGSFLLTAHLLEPGQRRVGSVTPPLGSPSFEPKHCGFLRATEAAGLTASDVIIETGDDFGVEPGHASGLRLLSRSDRPASQQRVTQNRESVLADQTIGSLAGDLARGSVSVVGDYFEAEAPAGPVDFETAAECFAAVATALTDGDHASIRQRGEAIAANRHEMVVAQLTSRLTELNDLLVHQAGDRLVTVLPAE